MMMCWDDVNDDDDKDVLSKYDSASNHEECMTFVRSPRFVGRRRLFMWVLFGGWLCVSKSVRENQFLRKNPTSDRTVTKTDSPKFKENEELF